MKREGVEIVKHYKDHNYMGFWEVIKHIKTILKNIKFVKLMFVIISLMH